MDDLEAVWGPDGRATVDPDSVRRGPRTVPADPPPARDRTERSRAPGAPEAFVVRVRPSGPSRALVVGAVAVVAVVAVAVLAVAARGVGRPRPAGDVAVTEADTAPTTIVSAAADLLHREGPGLAAPTTSSSSTSTSTSTTVPAGKVDLVAAEAAARTFVDAVTRRDCDAAWASLRSTSQRLLAAGGDGRNALCLALTSDDVPTMAVRGPARPAPDATGALVTVVAGADTEDLLVVLEGGRWVVDLLGTGSDRVADDPTNANAAADPDTGPAATQRDLRDALTAEKTILVEAGAYTADLAHLRRAEPSIDWRAGLATTTAAPGEVFVALADGGRTVCLSGRAGNGARFLVKDTVDGSTTYAGGEIPSVCDGRPLSSAW